MNVLLIEPYYGGSHRQWADGYIACSRHRVRLLSLPAQFWKWRMQGGAVTLARLFREAEFKPDVILASDMFDLSIFRALTRDLTRHIPIALYFHENQLTYPQNSRQKHGWRYGFINYASAMSADAIFFNSSYHLRAFFEALPRMLKHFGDYNELQTIDELRVRSAVLPVGLDLTRFDAVSVRAKMRPFPIIVWNHRWEEEKNPQAFFDAVYVLAEQGLEFYVAIAGENVRQDIPEFLEARERLGERVIQFGYMTTFEQYAQLLWQADYVVSAAYQDFFGMAVVEAIYCECVPLLPRRLNYPDLIPAEFHTSCLFDDGKLASLLKSHLAGELEADPARLRATVARFDWTTVAKQYDDALEAMPG